MDEEPVDDPEIGFEAGIIVTNKIYFVLRLPFSQAWEKGLGDEGTSAVIPQLSTS
jgi:hypothetical protein